MKITTSLKTQNKLNNHNNSYECMDSEDIDNGTFRTGLSSSNSNMLPLQCSANIGNIPTNAKQVRCEFMNYFNTDGQVPWQHNFIH